MKVRRNSPFTKMAAAIVLMAVLLALATIPVMTPAPVNAADTTMQWSGQGQNVTCVHGFWHWILTPGGNNTLNSATLVVNYSDGSQTVTAGSIQGQGGPLGAMHFNVNHSSLDGVTPITATSAYVNFSYTGGGGNFVLTISNSNCVVVTTTSTASTTSTTVLGTTSVPTTASSTTTTQAPTTVTTQGPQPTVSPTTVIPTTSTIQPITTTSQPRSTSTSIPVPSRVDAGGGGTAGSGDSWASSMPRMLFLLGALMAAALAVWVMPKRTTN